MNEMGKSDKGKQKFLKMCDYKEPIVRWIISISQISLFVWVWHSFRRKSDKILYPQRRIFTYCVSFKLYPNPFHISQLYFANDVIPILL